MPVLLGRRRTPLEFAYFVFDMAQMRPSGFRPHDGLVETAAARAGMVPATLPVRSARSERKAAARQRMLEMIRAERENPDSIPVQYLNRGARLRRLEKAA